MKEELVDIEKYTRCWACGRLIFKIRLEEHHVLEKTLNLTLPLCVLCHDLVDRAILDDWDIFKEYLSVFDELNQMPEGKYLMTKLLILKVFKLISKKKEIQNENSTLCKG